jgi:hypothetical protein
LRLLLPASAAEAAFGRDLELLVVDKGNHVLDVAQACAGVRGRVTMAPADLPAAAAVARPMVPVAPSSMIRRRTGDDDVATSMEAF